MLDIISIAVILLVVWIAVTKFSKSQAGNALSENVAIRSKASSVEIAIDVDAHAKSNGLKGSKEAKTLLDDLLS